MSGFRLSIFTFILAALGLGAPRASSRVRVPPASWQTRDFRLPWASSCHVASPLSSGLAALDPAAFRSRSVRGWRRSFSGRSRDVKGWAGAGSCGRGRGGSARLELGSRRRSRPRVSRAPVRKWARVLPSWPRASATVATVAATTSRPTSAALGAVVPANPEPMTGQGQSAAAGSAAWSTVFRHVRYENLVAGVSGGVLSNLALHPLDLVKIRFAGKSRPNAPGGFLRCQPQRATKHPEETSVSPASVLQGAPRR